MFSRLVLGFLVRQTRSTRPKTRLRGVRGLRRLIDQGHGPEVVPHLRAFMTSRVDDRYPSGKAWSLEAAAKEEAAECLGRLRDREAVDALLYWVPWFQYLSSPLGVQIGPACARALVAIGDPRAVPALAPMAGIEPDACRCLAQLGDAGHQVIVAALLKGPSDKIVDTLVEIGWEPADDYEKAAAAIAVRNPRAATGEEGVRALIAALHATESYDRKLMLIEALGLRLADPRALEALLPLRDDRDERTKKMVNTILGRAGWTPSGGLSAN